MVAGIYESRGEADAARARLIDEGVPEERIRIEQRDTAGSVPMPPQNLPEADALALARWIAQGAAQ